MRAFLVGQSASLLGDGVAVLAVPLLVLRLTDDPVAAGLAAAPRGIGYLMVGLVAGTLVDRWEPRRVLLVADGVRAVGFTVLGLPGLGVGAILVVASGCAVASVFADAGLAVSVRDLFPGELVRANAALETAAQTALVLGPALVGVLAATVGLGPALLFNAGTFLISFGSVVATRWPAAPPRRRRGLAAEFAEGLRFLAGHRPLLVLTVAQTLVNVFLAVDALLVYLAKVTLALPLSRVTAIVAAGGAAGIAGALVVPALARRCRPIPLITAAIVVTGLAVTAQGLARSWWQVAAANAVETAALVVAGVVNRATRQEWIPRELVARVSATVRTFFVTASPVGVVLAGLAIKACDGDARPVFAGAGVATCLVMWVAWRSGLRLAPPGRGR